MGHVRHLRLLQCVAPLVAGGEGRGVGLRLTKMSLRLGGRLNSNLDGEGYRFTVTGEAASKV